MKLVLQFLSLLSPVMLDMARQGAREWKKRALETNNPLDDIAAEFMCSLLRVDDSGGSK